VKKRVFSLLFPLCLLVVSGSQASNVDVGINVNIGAPAIVIASPPEFLLIPSLGLHVSIGAPYDLFYLDGHYYHFDNNRWYRSNHYQGPWGYVDRRHLPKRMLKHEYREMIDWRDREYREYNKDRGKHRDRYFRPDDKHERKGERRDDDHKGKNRGKHGGKD
jgi:hypothetical protein